LQLTDTVKDDILQLLEHSSLIITVFRKHQDLFLVYFSDLHIIYKFEILFKISWLIFCICKITSLKRKYEKDSSFCLLISVYSIIRDYTQGLCDIKIGNFENLVNELGIKNIHLSHSLKELIGIQLCKVFKSKNIGQIFTEHYNDFNSFYNTLNSYYLTILLPDEINDMLIYDHYLEQNYFNPNLKNEFNNNSIQNVSTINSESNYDNSITLNENLDIINWISKIEIFSDCDTFYLYQKYTNIHFTRKRLILFVEIYDNFKSKIL